MRSQSSVHWQTIREALRGARKVVVTCHHSPDGDALSAILGLTASLRAIDLEASAISPSPVPRSYAFLPGAAGIAVYRPDGAEGTNEATRQLLLDADVIFSLDCSDLERLGALYQDNKPKFESTPVVNIDHHGSNSDYGTLALVNPDAASVCEFLVVLMEREDLPITPEIAQVLLVGIVADTLGFRTGATTASTLKLAASLIEKGASLSWASESVFNNRSAPGLRLWGQVLSRSVVEGRLVWSDITREMLEQSGATLADADMLVDFIAGVPGTSGAFLFSEQDGQVRVSMRTSATLNASDLASHFGGGGHPRAAGCTLDGALGDVKVKVLAEARSRLDGMASNGDGQQEIDA